MTIVHHLGQLSQDSRNLPKFQVARGKSPSESIGALDMNSRNESCMIKRRSSGSMATQPYRQWHLSTSWGNGHSQKNITHNQRPARSTGQGKNKGFPANQKGSGKNKERKWKKKIVHPASRKPEKAAWAKKGIPVDWKPESAVQQKFRDQSVTLCLIGSPRIQTSVSIIKLEQH